MLYTILFTSSLIFTFRAAAFKLYPSVNPDSLAKSFGISTDCLDALNETVTCDQTLFQMSNSVDSYLWTLDNVTDLCTADCTQSAQRWLTDVQNRCDADTISAHGKMVPAESIAERFTEGLNIACLRPSSSNSNSSLGSGPYSNSTGSYSNSTGPNSNLTGPYLNSSLISNSSSSTSSWCLIDSQDWVGSDIISPDCSNNSTDPQCSDLTNVSPENERIANLYDNDLLCSDCFLKMFHLRMSSPYLPDSDYSDYLVAQYQDILDVCEATMPELTVRALPYYRDVPGMYDGVLLASNVSSNLSLMAPHGNGTRFSNSTNGNSICTGQTISAADLTNASFSGNGTGCDVLSSKYGVTTGDLQNVIGDAYCIFSSPSYCLPAACTLTKISSGATCDSIASSVSTGTYSNISAITTIQFMTWNPNINGLCDSLNEGDYVCISAPGGSYVPPAISNATKNAGALQRGGGDGSDTGVSSNSAISSSNSTAPAATSGSNLPTPSTIASTTIPTLGATPASSSAAGTPTAASPSPSPTQSGIASPCAKYTQAHKGDSCSSFATANNISPANLYSWNSVLGDGGKNCDTMFWGGYYYCVGQ